MEQCDSLLRYTTRPRGPTPLLRVTATQPLGHHCSSLLACERCPRRRERPAPAALQSRPSHNAQPVKETRWRERRPSARRHAFCSTALCSQHSGHREQQSVYELITHHHCRCIDPIHAQHNRPQPMKVPIKKTALFAQWNRTTPQLPHLPHHPHIQEQPSNAMLGQQFQISVMRIKHFLSISTDKTWQLRRHSMETPPGPWAIQKHLPTRGINRLSEVHWPTLFEAISQHSAKPARSRHDRQDGRGHNHPRHKS